VTLLLGKECKKAGSSNGSEEEHKFIKNNAKHTITLITKLIKIIRLLLLNNYIRIRDLGSAGHLSVRAEFTCMKMPSKVHTGVTGYCKMNRIS
jgi:hypothetical protein